MLTIGELAGVTGLSVKALRHYDEKGVLRPVEVDDRTGYRRYGEGQVRTGVLVKALRDAGVPLADVADAVAGDAAEGAIAAHRERVLAERETEDHAHRRAMATLAALDVPVTVAERTSPAQWFIGRVIAVPNEEVDDLTDEAANAEFGELFLRMRTAGIAPTGRFWTTLRTGEGGEVEIIGCWPVEAEPPAGFASAPAVVGRLPERVDLVATWRPAGDEELPDGAAHPAVVALFDALAGSEAVVAATEVRQTPLGDHEGDASVEVAITLRVR